MNRRSSRTACLALLALGAAGIVATAATRHAMADSPRGGPVVLVTGQGLYYDTIVLGELPQRGPFQLLVMDGPTGLMTEFGPGDPGYRGGRWWVDVNENGMQDDEDDFFLCPLLPPGREEP